MRWGLALGGVLLATAGLVSCGGDDGDPEVDEDDRTAMPIDFCAAAEKFEMTFTETDTGNLAEGLEALKDTARELKDVGTPEDIPDDAREGLALTLDKLLALPDDSVEADLLAVLDLTEDERAKSMAFEDYLDETCVYRDGSDGSDG